MLEEKALWVYKKLNDEPNGVYEEVIGIYLLWIALAMRILHHLSWKEPEWKAKGNNEHNHDECELQEDAIASIHKEEWVNGLIEPVQLHHCLQCLDDQNDGEYSTSYSHL